jgi:type IV secretory pathway TrbD component
MSVLHEHQIHREITELQIMCLETLMHTVLDCNCIILLFLVGCSIVCVRVQYFVTTVMWFVAHVYVKMEMSIYPSVRSVENSRTVNKSEHEVL